MKLKYIPPIHREGYIFIIIGTAFAFLSGAIMPTIGWVAAMVTIFIICFFRDPDRVSPEGENLIISPADGIVHKIEDATAPEELNLGKQTYKRVSIFLSVFNVHVNRVPMSGTITDLHYRSGKFFNAALEKASKDNERQTCVVQNDKGEKIIFVQIAGLIAKRIICELDVNQEVKAGDKFGIIRFGSRMDVYFPSNSNIKVLEGQTTIGGETILGELASKSASKPITAKKTVAKKTVTKKAVAKKKPQDKPKAKNKG